jgi:predicted aminopeptidase
MVAAAWSRVMRFAANAVRRGVGRGLALAFLMLAVGAIFGGCEVGYVARAAWEEGRVLWRRKPIDTVLARGDLPADVRVKLKTVLEVRDFARDDLGLNVGGAYKSIADVDRDAIVWVVMAAPRDSLKPYTWWFPIVGEVPYRGYFNKEHAEAEAEEMEKGGLDTMVRPAVAFSSLGFFNDPLLSDLLRLGSLPE